MWASLCAIVSGPCRSWADLWLNTFSSRHLRSSALLTSSPPLVRNSSVHSQEDINFSFIGESNFCFFLNVTQGREHSLNVYGVWSNTLRMIFNMSASVIERCLCKAWDIKEIMNAGFSVSFHRDTLSLWLSHCLCFSLPCLPCHHHLTIGEQKAT